MKNILHELYYGNIQPIEGRFMQQHTYQELSEKAMNMEIEFLSKLNEEETKLYNELIKATYDKNTIEEAEIYSDGFILGARIMLTCLLKSGEEQ